MFSSEARSCSWQFWERTQVVQSPSCCERISFRFVSLAVLARCEFVCTTMPSATFSVQEGTRRSKPSTSTTQMRQAEISLMPFR